MEIPARHPKKGDCIIRECTHPLGRVRVLVDYPNLGISRRPEFLDELVDRATGQPITLQSPSAAPAPLVERPHLPDWQRARQSLLALRLGQSTAETVRDLSVGLSEVDAACRKVLDRAGSGQPSFLLFVSPYGMGKSHVLARLRELSHERKMATGTVVLDGVGTTLCRPLGLISALSHSIVYPESSAGEGLPQRLAGLVRTGAVEKLRDARAEMLHRTLMNLSSEHVDDPDQWEAVEDYLSLEVSAPQAGRVLGVRLPPLNTRSLCDRPGRTVDLLREWARACTVTGAPGGLTMLLDEADVDYGNRGRTSSELRQRAGLLMAWRQMADAGPQGGNYARLVVALAMTPESDQDGAIEELKAHLGPHLHVVVLRELRDDEMRELGSKVCNLYRAAYELNESIAATDDPITECLVAQQRSTEQRNPRRFIRLLLEKLDVAHA